MIKITHLLLAGAVVLSICSRGIAQDARPTSPVGTSDAAAARLADAITQDGVPEPLPGAPDEGVGSGILQALPRPRAVPESLFAPPDPPSPGGMPVGGPYLQYDPFLDPPVFPQPGWFAGAEAQIVKPHLITRMEGSVIAGKNVNWTSGQFPLPGSTSIVNLPSANLSWTAAPRVFVGYRLPSGFGEFMVAYRNLASTGSGVDPGSHGPVDIGTRFRLNTIDFDYNSRELSLWPQWDMKWSVGLRTLFLNWAAQGTQPFDQAPSGGVFQARAVNNNFSLGPHAALQLDRHLGNSGWSLSTRVDAAGLFDFLDEGWLTKSGAPGGAGQPRVGALYAFRHQASPMFTGRIGLNWQPSPDSGMKLYIGYQYDVIWDLNGITQSQPSGFSPSSTGQFWDQGIVLQVTFKY
jgi:hypothetical protein